VIRALLAAFIIALLATPAAARVLRYEDVEKGPFDPKADATADIEAAFLVARARDRRVLAVLGGNWCHDSRALARYLDDPAVKRIIDSHYVVVFVDVGRRDRNLDIAKRFEAPDLTGTPTLLVLNAPGRLMNAPSTSDWTSADSRSAAELAKYLEDLTARR
jgi:hypothetical protein